MEASSPARLIDRRHAALVAGLLAVAAACWLLTARRMAGMDGGSGTDPGSLGFYLGAWTLMMAAMMFPSAAPAVAVYASLQRDSRSAAPWLAGPTAFAGGYLLAWTGFGLIAYAAFELARALQIDALGWDRYGPWAAAAVIALAGVYQLTPLKDTCLRRCRNPVTFLLGSWRDGRIGAVRMGAEHGCWCIGCCWALMAALFALGLMSIAWMALVATFVAAEKLLPWQRAASGAVAASLIVLAAGLAVAPHRVPALTDPASAPAMKGMSGGAMEMQDEGMKPMAGDEPR